MKSRNDEPYKLFSKSERWARLRLVRHILDRTVEQGNVPEEVAERAFEFSSYLETLRQRHHAWPNAEDTAVILGDGCLAFALQRATTITSA